ncbi:MAG: hypothetical protein ACRDRZ_18785 [Pseudonocardiaceae bacterium]
MSKETQENENTATLRHGDGNGQQAQCDIGRSIRPGVPVPATVLVADMGHGALLCQAWRHGPSAYVCAEDAGRLREALEAAFGSNGVRRAGPVHTGRVWDGEPVAAVTIENVDIERSNEASS